MFTASGLAHPHLNCQFWLYCVALLSCRACSPEWFCCHVSCYGPVESSQLMVIETALLLAPNIDGPGLLSPAETTI